jgi:hypothetical protein
MINRPLSLKDFKNWLAEDSDLKDFFNIGREPEDPNDRFIGKAVRPKVGEKKLLERIETEDDAESLVIEFVEEGGTILAVEEKRVHIEVESGSFYIPRFCVKIQKDQ